MVTPILDKDAEILASGKRPRRVIKARNWRLVLDLNNPEDKADHEALLKNEQNGTEFWQLKDADKSKGDFDARAQTLDKLYQMSEQQLLTMLDEDELKNAGLIDGAINKSKLILAIIDNKKLTGGGIR